MAMIELCEECWRYGNYPVTDEDNHYLITGEDSCEQCEVKEDEDER